MIIEHPNNEAQTIDLGPDFSSGGPVTVPPHGEVELRGKFGPHIARGIRVVPGYLDDYAGRTPRLTLARAVLYPRSSCTIDGDSVPVPAGSAVIWGGGVPSSDDFEQRPDQQGIPRDSDGVAVLRVKTMLTGSAIGVVVRNNTESPIEASISVTYTSLGGWCVVTTPDEARRVMAG